MPKQDSGQLKNLRDVSKDNVGYDLEYIDNWSFMMDFRIALKTVSTIVSGTGV